MNKNRYITCFLLLLLSLQLPLFARVNDTLVFRAMQDELLRNKEQLKLANFDAPFFLAYTLNFSSQFEVRGSLGAITNSGEQPINAVGTVRLMTGDNYRTNDFTYTGQGVKTPMPIEVDYNEIRRNFWLATDIAYKSALQQYASKEAYLKANPKSAEQEKINDFSLENTTDHLVTSVPEFQMDKKQWETQIAALSAVFKKYKELFNSTVALSGMQVVIYKATSDGLQIKEPQSFATLSAAASVYDIDGVKIQDTWSLTLRTPQDFPSLAELEKKITAFAEGLIRLSKLEKMPEFYSGPVLFADGACSKIFTNNLLKPGYLLAFRQAEGKKAEITLDGRMERKIIDSRLSVKNYANLTTYNNTPLFGHYKVDAEGVVPPKETVLIENGILRRQLNGRIPTLKAPASTGSSRFAISGSEVYFCTSPGIVHISATDGMKIEKMKKALLKAAVEEGLDYAYIVRKIDGAASLVYKVDVKTGVETQVRAGEFTELNLSRLKRLREISAQEKVVNYLSEKRQWTSLIYPSAILIDDVEINRPDFRKEKTPALTFPLQRSAM